MLQQMALRLRLSTLQSKDLSLVDLAPPLSRWYLGKLLNLFKPQFPHVKMGIIKRSTSQRA